MSPTARVGHAPRADTGEACIGHGVRVTLRFPFAMTGSRKLQLRAGGSRSHAQRQTSSGAKDSPELTESGRDIPPEVRDVDREDGIELRVERERIARGGPEVEARKRAPRTRHHVFADVDATKARAGDVALHQGEAHASAKPDLQHGVALLEVQRADRVRRDQSVPAVQEPQHRRSEPAVRLGELRDDHIPKQVHAAGVVDRRLHMQLKCI